MATKFKLLNVDANPKTIKGQSKGYMTAVLYMTPANGADPDENFCPAAEIAGCLDDCLNTAGRGGMAPGNGTFATPAGRILPDNTVQRARLRRALMFIQQPDEFMRLLMREIFAAYLMAEKAELELVVRLNGTQDIRWENVKFSVSDEPFHAAVKHTIFEWFPYLQFYDYTKLPNRRAALKIPNYHLTFSYSARPEFAPIVVKALQTYGNAVNMAVVFSNKIPMPEYFLGREVINGDEHDLRFKDRKGVVVALKAKGRARNSKSDFIVHSVPSF